MGDKSFVSGDYVVYPSHGVGKVASIEEQEISGYKLQVMVIAFTKDKMTLRLPTNKARSSGLRGLSSKNDLNQVVEVLNSKIITKKGNTWAKRHQEYELKINSGSVVSLAEVVRELHKEGISDQSYSEKQVYKSAFERLVEEFAMVEAIAEDKAAEKIEKILEAA